MFESLIRRYLEQSQNSNKLEQVTFDPANLQTSALSAVNNMRETFGFEDRDSLIRLFEELGETRTSAQHYARAIDDNKLIKIEKKKPFLANALKLLAQYVGLSPIIGIDTASFAIPLIQLEHIPRSEAIRLHDSGGKTAPDLCHAYLSMGHTGLEAVKYMRQVVIGPLTVTTAKGELAVSGWMKAQQYVTQQLKAKQTPCLERYLAALGVDEEEIIRAVYGINRDVMSQTDIAESLGEDTKTIYGLKERALNKLHNLMLSDRSMFQHWIDLEEKLAKDPPNYLASRSLSRLEI